MASPFPLYSDVASPISSCIVELVHFFFDVFTSPPPMSLTSFLLLRPLTSVPISIWYNWVGATFSMPWLPCRGIQYFQKWHLGIKIVHNHHGHLWLNDWKYGIGVISTMIMMMIEDVDYWWLWSSLWQLLPVGGNSSKISPNPWDKLHRIFILAKSPIKITWNFNHPEYRPLSPGGGNHSFFVHNKGSFF